MRLLLDTNRYSDLHAGEPETTSRFRRASEVWLSLITLGELRAGFQGGSQQDENEKWLTTLLEVRGVGILSPNDETTRYYAETLNKLRKAGRPIPTNDIWIAAQALQHNLTLDTRDKHFKNVTGLRLA